MFVCTKFFSSRVLIVVWSVMFMLPLLRAERNPAAPTNSVESFMSGERQMHATGTFQVKIEPAEPTAIAKAADVGRMTIDKTWSGEMTGTSKGEMLTGLTKSTGSMAYVAMERVQATLEGRNGTFLFQHSGYMQAGDAASSSLNVQVVKGSGTGELAGISGSLSITIKDGVHLYDFTYSLPDRH